MLYLHGAESFTRLSCLVLMTLWAGALFLLSLDDRCAKAQGSNPYKNDSEGMDRVGLEPRSV